MSLPRVVIDVVPRSGPRGEPVGWRVHCAGTPGHDLDALVVSGRRVPVLPVDRTPADGDHAALCTGDAARIGDLLNRIATRRIERGDVVTYGRWLFECLLAPIWADICTSARVRTARGVELALRWPADAADLHGLVWEAMHDGESPLAGHRRFVVAVTRLVPVADVPDQPADPIRSGGRERPGGEEPRLLLAAGSALTDDTIHPGAMFMGLLRAFESEGLCTPLVVQDVTIGELTDVAARFQPDLVHLVAHGELDEGRGVLLLAPHKVGGGAVNADALLPALTGRHSPLVAILSACQSGVAGPGAVAGREAAVPLAVELVRGGIPVVVAMAGEVGEQACRLYTRRMIHALHRGEPVVDAAAQGRRAALVHTAAPADQLDWAMPALFLAESVQPGFQIVDPDVTQRVIRLADELKLRQRPVFIGRYDVLGLVDRVFATEEDRRLGFVAIVRDGPIGNLGGTRLLREIGYRLLRRGHLPLFLGPYGPSGAPASLRGLVTEILRQCVDVAEALALPPVTVVTLSIESRLASAAQVDAAALGEPSVDEAYIVVRRALSEFRRGVAELDPGTVRAALRSDLNRLAARAGATGRPFGPHTRPLILGDRAHAWPDALDALLSMVGRSGLGTPAAPIPVMVTGSLREHSGPRLKDFRDENAGATGFAFPALEPLSAAEAALGFQWVLLHPWRPANDPVYTPARTVAPQKVRQVMGRLDGMPTAVRQELYLLAGALADLDLFVASDDEAAYRVYLERYG